MIVKMDIDDNQRRVNILYSNISTMNTILVSFPFTMRKYTNKNSLRKQRLMSAHSSRSSPDGGEAQAAGLEDGVILQTQSGSKEQ